MKKRLVILALCTFLLSCGSIEKMAMNAVSDMLTGEGSSTVFTGDSDPELVGDALPFAIKMYESLLDANPDHEGLMLTTGMMFVMYANAFVQGPAEMLPMEEWKQRDHDMMRAKNLYLRGYAILSNALEKKCPGFSQVTEANLPGMLNRFNKNDVGLLYWTVAGGMAAYSIDIFDFNLSSNIPKWIAMILKAYELDPNYDVAALDEFLLIFYGSLPEIMGGDKEKAEYHFLQAQEKTGGQSTGAYVSYAQAICVPAQDYESYKDYLEKALNVDVNANPSTRLVNIINQRKAQWLLANAYNYFSFLPIPDGY